MKQTKFICLLLCIILTGSLFAGCNTAAESKNDVSENSVDENLSSPTDNEATPWGAEEDWDFLKSWKVHGEFEPLLVNAVEEQNPHHDNLFKAIMETHEQKGYKFLIHMQITAFDLEEAKLQYPFTENAKQIDAQEVLCWFEAGNIPVKYENGVLHGDISYNDMKKIIEYGKEAGYQLFFSNYCDETLSNAKCLEGKALFECPFCDGELTFVIEERVEIGDVILDIEEEIYRDDEWIYYFSDSRSEFFVVVYSDGTEQGIKEALAEGNVSITDLDTFDVPYSKKSIEE